MLDNDLLKQNLRFKESVLFAIAIRYKKYEKDSNKKQLEKLTKKIGYLLNHREGIVHRKTLDILGSCTEGQASHVLSKDL